MRVFKYSWYIVLIATIIGFSSCEYDATNVDIPVIESKLVVQCFISPQKTKVEALVSFSSPIYGNNKAEDWIDNATVEITNGTIQKKLTLNNNGFRPKYEIDSNDFKIEAGRTYTLYVSTPDGRTVNATCTVPFKIDSTSLVYNWDSVVTKKPDVGSIDRTIRLNMKWTDRQQGENYFRAGANVLIYAENNPNNVLKERMSNNSYSDLFTDAGKDGATLERNSLERTVTSQVGGSVGQFSFIPKGIEIYILNCEENYYKYHKTSESNNIDDPFSEPTLVFSNIIGGLGCFGASNEYIKTIDF